MHTREIKIENERAAITVWVDASILGSENKWIIKSTDTVAALYNPRYEGEYYFTPNPLLERQSTYTRIAYHLFDLETSDDALKKAIQKRKEYLITLTENPALDPLNLDPQQWFALCDKIANTAYSQPLKMALAQKDVSHVDETLVFIPHKNMTERDCLEAAIMISKNIVLQISKPRCRAKQLLKLCATVQKVCFLTDLLVCFLLGIYYEIYIIFSKPENKELPDFYELMFEFFVCLKQLIVMENTSAKHHEMINLLLCTPFECGMQRQSSINHILKGESSDIYFNKALQCHFAQDNNINYSWGNALRLSLLRCLRLNGKHDHSSIDQIALALIKVGHEKSAIMSKADCTSLLPIRHRKNITLAIHYYSMVIWLKNVNLYDDAMLKCYAVIKEKITMLRQHLKHSLTEERLFITKPIITYIKAGNPVSPNLSNSLKTIEFPEQLFSGNNERNLTKEQFLLLIELCNDKVLPYSSDVSVIIWLDLYYQIYHFVHRNKVFRNNAFVKNLEVNILLLQQSTNENHMLHEVYDILLFQTRHLLNKATRNLPDFKEKTGLFFTQAIQFHTTQFLKADWITLLRKKALLNYLKHFCTIPNIKLHTTLEKIFSYLNDISQANSTIKVNQCYILEAKEILAWAKNVQLLTEPLPELLAETPPAENIKPTPEPTSSPAKQLEPNAQVKQQKAEARRIRREEQKKELAKELEAKEAQEQMRREQEKKDKEEARLQRALQEAAEEARKKQEREQRTQLQANKRVARKAAEEQQKAEKRKLREQEQAQKELQKTQEQAKLELKYQQELVLEAQTYEAQRQTLVEENFKLKQMRKASILERPLRCLRNFSLDELGNTVSQDNYQSLNDLISALGTFGILEIYGSYVIFLASVRLGIPLEKIKTPGDIDIRIKLHPSNLENYSLFIEKLFSLGFECKEFNKIAHLTNLQEYLAERECSQNCVSKKVS